MTPIRIAPCRASNIQAVLELWRRSKTAPTSTDNPRALWTAGSGIVVALLSLLAAWAILH